MRSPKNKIIIEATQTFSPGNVELLIYLLKKFELSQFNITLYLGHESTYDAVRSLNIQNLNILRSKTIDVFIRSFQKRSNVLFFCSYPPLRKHKKSIVYFHSSFFLNIKNILLNKNINFKIKFTRIIIHSLIRFFNGNVDAFYCQTTQIKNQLSLNFRNIKVELKPFFNDFEINKKQRKENNNYFDFFYPATADVHKNYFTLFDAILVLGRRRKISLVVTISNEKINFVQKITEVNNLLGYDAIINIGRVSKLDIIDYYRKAKAMVFPSLEESLGLPLIEASVMNLPIIGSDLPYIYDVVENPIVFDPKNPEDIAEKMENFLEGKYQNVIQTNKINNQVQEVINYFKD